MAGGTEMTRTLTFALAVAMVTAAHAADVTLVAKETPTTPAIIYVKGQFDKSDDYERFVAVAGSISKAVIFFHSPGGMMRTGIGIGLAIRNRQFATAVWDKERCASACAIAWISELRVQWG
jgi:hypothetical protein